MYSPAKIKNKPSANFNRGSFKKRKSNPRTWRLAALFLLSLPERIGFIGVFCHVSKRKTK